MPWSRSSRAGWLRTGPRLPPDVDPDGFARAGHAAAGSAAVALDARPRRFRARLLDHDHLGGAAATPAHVHDVRLVDRPRHRGRGRLRPDAVADCRPFERFFPLAARLSSPGHYRCDLACAVL